MGHARIVLGIGCVATLIATGTTSASGAAAPLGCGSTITADTTLRADIGPCPGDGLVVAADNVTLNLAGHRVFGTSAQGAFAGIRLPRRTGVTVKGPGTVDNFDAGVVMGEGSHNTVHGLRLHHNISSQFVADHPNEGFLGDGIVLFSSSHNRLIGNHVFRNGPFSGIAIAGFGGDSPNPRGNVVRGNTVVDNDVPELCSKAGTTTEYPGVPCSPRTPVFNQDIGIRIEGPEASRNTVSGNSVARNGREGISVLNDPDPANRPNAHNAILGNLSRDNGFTGFDFQGFFLYGNGIELRCFRSSNPTGCAVDTLVEGNQSTGNSGSGIRVGFFAHHNTIVGNQAFANQDWDGADDSVDPPCDHNTWRDNWFVTGNQRCVGAQRTEPPDTAAAAAEAAPPATGPVPRVARAGRAA